MIRFHHGSPVQRSLDIYFNGKLIIANITSGSTSLYIQVCSGVMKGFEFGSKTLVFKSKMKIREGKKYTCVLSRNKLTVYKDNFCTPKNGHALMRTLNSAPVSTTTSSPMSAFEMNQIPWTNVAMANSEKPQTTNTNQFIEVVLGPQTFKVGNLSITVDVINKGVYTIFYDESMDISSVLYNDPSDMVQEICFEDYIGKWYVAASLPSTQNEKFYVFSETSSGRFELTNNSVGIFNWIVHKTDYETYSLNGSENRQRLAIITRKGMSKCMFEELVCLADELGYNTKMLVKNK